MKYIITHTPTESFRNDKGTPVTYSSALEAMAALVAWARETNLPAHDFIVTEYEVNNTKFAYNPNRSSK
jgi:hypothetical protein